MVILNAPQLLAGALVAVTVVERQIRNRAIAQQILSARIVISLSVDRNITDQNFARISLNPGSKADLDGDVGVLRDSGEIVGLEVWGLSGSLIYADSGHPVGEVAHAPKRAGQQEDQRARAQGADGLGQMPRHGNRACPGTQRH